MLEIKRVLALPDPLVADTIYLTPGAAAGSLIITVVGNNIGRPKSIGLDALLATVAAQGTALAAVSGEIDTKIAAAIAALDPSNSALYAADITARDAMALAKNSFVLVADASADPTVDAGAATYFYNKDAAVGSRWTKVAEFESMDVNIPNKAVLDQLSDIDGLLAYRGAQVATVQLVTADW